MNHEVKTLLDSLGVGHSRYAAKINSETGLPGLRYQQSPVDGSSLGAVKDDSAIEIDQAIAAASGAFKSWRMVPAPGRGSLVGALAARLTEVKAHLGALVSWECGKSLQEGLGEVQEMIDICHFAQGLSRSIHGLSLPSERKQHRILEQYQPLGVVGVISAFNFPVAVWSWNLALALVCGDTLVWKPSEKTPLTALACQSILDALVTAQGHDPNIAVLVTGGQPAGAALAEDARVALVSATGSVRMGRSVALAVAARLGRSLLELGGNNAVILSEKANVDAMLPGIVFGAVGTAGQRCTSTRRLIVHESIAATVREKLGQMYAKLRIGNPLDENNHVGPLIDVAAVESYQKAISLALAQGARILVEGGVLEGAAFASGCYVRPCVLEAEASSEFLKVETFAPILYLVTYRDLPEAIAIQNNVPQGLSSAIMTADLAEAEFFLSAEGSDCGIANVNTGTSGAEIGGAFGGEKETGGGRESGSDAWKAYMRRQTSTIHAGNSFSLAQGIRFDV